MRTSSLSAVIRFVAKARARVTASGRPSGTVTTTKVTEMIKMFVKVIPFSLGALREEQRFVKKTETTRGSAYRTGSPVPN